MNSGRLRIPFKFRESRLLVALTLACASASGVFVDSAAAQSGHPVYIPITFKTDSDVIRTSACLQVNEQLNPLSSDKPNSGNAQADEAFQAVFAAIKRKDKEGLLNLSDPARGRDPKQFDQQANAYFAQSEKLDLIGVPRTYQFDGLIVFLAKLKSSPGTTYAPFVFALGDSGSYGFLPYRTDIVSYKLLEEWLFAKWGPVNTDSPSYCAAPKIEAASHSVALAASAVKTGSSRSHLFLKGAPVESPGDLRPATSEVQSALDSIHASLEGNRMEEFYSALSPSAVGRVRDSFLSADVDGRKKFKESITRQEPFFVFDASPLLIAYTKTPEGKVQVMYFLVDAQHKLTWTNPYTVTVVDRIFKKGTLYESALLRRPFNSVAIHPESIVGTKP